MRFGSQYGRFATCRWSPAAPLARSTARPRRAASARPAAPPSSAPLAGAAGPARSWPRSTASDGQRPRQHAATSISRTAATSRSSRTTSSTSPTSSISRSALRYTNESKKFDADLRQRQYGLPRAAGGARAVPHQSGARGGRRRPDRPHLPGQFDRRAQRRRSSTTSAARTSSPAPACSRSSPPTTCCSTPAIRAAIRRAASTSTARRSSRRSCPSRAPGGAQALVGNLQFDPEIINAYEIGAKYSARAVHLQRRRCSARISRTSSSTRSTAPSSSSRTSTAATTISADRRATRRSSSATRRLQRRRPRPAPAAAMSATASARRASSSRPRSGRCATCASPLGLTYANTNIATIWSATTMARRSIRRCASLPGEICRTRRSIVTTGVARLDPAIGGTGLSRPVLRRWPLHRRATTPAPTCSRRRSRTASRWSTPASACAGPTSAGRSSSGRRTCSTPTITRSRSTRRSRQARQRAASSIRPSRAGARSSRPSSPSRAPTA